MNTILKNLRHFHTGIKAKMSCWTFFIPFLVALCSLGTITAGTLAGSHFEEEWHSRTEFTIKFLLPVNKEEAPEWTYSVGAADVGLYLQGQSYGTMPDGTHVCTLRFRILSSGTHLIQQTDGSHYASVYTYPIAESVSIQGEQTVNGGDVQTYTGTVLDQYGNNMAYSGGYWWNWTVTLGSGTREFSKNEFIWTAPYVSSYHLAEIKLSIDEDVEETLLVKIYPAPITLWGTTAIKDPDTYGKIRLSTHGEGGRGEDYLQYQWSISEGDMPAGASVSFSDANKQFAYANASHEGTYTFLVSVTDGYTTETDNVSITIGAPPEFIISSFTAEPVTYPSFLNWVKLKVIATGGTGSFDYIWSVTDKPVGASVDLGFGSFASSGTAIVSHPGVYEFEVTVRDIQTGLVATKRATASVGQSQLSLTDIVATRENESSPIHVRVEARNAVGSVSFSWSGTGVTGGTVGFTAPSSAETDVNLSEDGKYLLTVSATDEFGGHVSKKIVVRSGDQNLQDDLPQVNQKQGIYDGCLSDFQAIPVVSFSHGQSLIDNTKLTHMHTATDYIHQLPTGGCSSCPAPNYDLPRLQLDRVHRYADIDHIGSYGPGVFNSYDKKLYLYSYVANRIEYWNPQGTGSIIAEPNGNEYTDPQQSIKHIRLFDDSGTQTMDHKATVKAVVTSWSGEELVFEIIDTERAEEPFIYLHCGRLSTITDRNGNGITIDYVYDQTATSEELSHDYNRLWMINTITDGYGFTCRIGEENYVNTSGFWVVAQAILPDNTAIVYEYDQDMLVGLNKVRYADGSVSSFAYQADASNGLFGISYHDVGAETIHRRKTVYWTLPTIDLEFDGEEHRLNQVPYRVRQVKNGAGELSYKNWLDIGSNGKSTTYIWEAGGPNGQGVLKNYETNDGIPVRSCIAKKFDLDESPTSNSYDWEVLEEFSTDTAVRVTEHIETGENGFAKRRTVFDPDVTEDDVLERIEYVPAGVDAENKVIWQEFSRYSHKVNAFRQPLEEIHEDGTKTVYDYDDKGNVLSITRADDVVGVESTIKYTYYGDNDTAPAGLVKTSEDAEGHITNYTYYPSGLLQTKTMPPDEEGGVRGVYTYTYYNDSGRLRSVKDPANRETIYRYDERGRLQYIDHPNNTTESFVYNTSGTQANLLEEHIDSNGVSESFDYDLAGRLITHTVDANNVESDSATVLTYPSGARIASSTVVNGTRIEHDYDHQQRPLATRSYFNDTEFQESTTQYDQEGRPFILTDYHGRRSFIVYDDRSRPIRTIKEAWKNPSELSVFAALTTESAQVTFLKQLARLPETTETPAYVITDQRYDIRDRVTWSADTAGIVTTFEYNELNQLVAENAAVYTHTLDAQAGFTDTFTVITDSSIPARTAYEYDANGQQTKIIYPKSFALTITTNSITVAPGLLGEFSTETAYTQRGLVQSRTKAAGLDETASTRPEKATESFSYTVDGKLALHTDYRSNEWANIYGSCCGAKLVSQDPSGAAIITRRDGNDNITHRVTVSDYSLVSDLSNPPATAQVDGKIVRVTLAETTTQYDGRNRPISQTQWFVPLELVDSFHPPAPPSTSDQGLTTWFLYDDHASDGIGIAANTIPGLSVAANFSSEVDDLDLGANATGSARLVVSPTHEVSVTIADGLGRTVKSFTAALVSGSWSIINRVEIEPSIEITTLPPFAGVSLEKRTTTRNFVGSTPDQITAHYYDGFGRILATEDALTHRSTAIYNARGQQVRTRSPEGRGQDRVYDERGRLKTITDTNLDGSTYSYDVHGNTISSTDALSKITTQAYDALDRLKEVTDRLSGKTTYTYDNGDNVKTITDAEDKVTTYGYNSRGLLESILYANGKTRGMTYDGAGRLKVATNQAAETATNTYDLVGRLTNVAYSADSTSDSFTYDDASRLLTATGGRYSTEVIRAYDDFGRLKTEQQKSTHPSALFDQTVSYSIYDEQSRLKEITYPSTHKAEFAYTDRNELQSVEFMNDLAVHRIYTADGQPHISSYGNGVIDTRTYRETDGMLATIIAEKASTDIVNLNHTPAGASYDANKRLKAIVDSVTPTQTQTFDSYDAEGRLTAWNRRDTTVAGTSQETESWTLSLVGDWDSVTTGGTTEARTHDDIHAVTQHKTQTISYDDKGNITANPTRMHGYTWDQQNRLSGMDNDTTDATATNNIAYRYDALGRRVSKTVDGTTTAYTYNGSQVIGEYDIALDGTATLGQEFVYGSYVDEPVAMRKADGTTYYYHSDRRYSVQALTDSNGVIVERYAYTPFGEMTLFDGSGTEIAQSAVGNSYTYTGRRYDNESGLYYFRARMYDAELGRFLSQDPLGYVDGMSLYTGYFAPNGVDPFGLTDWDLMMGVVDPVIVIPPLHDPGLRSESEGDNVGAELARDALRRELLTPDPRPYLNYGDGFREANSNQEGWSDDNIRRVSQDIGTTGDIILNIVTLGRAQSLRRGLNAVANVSDEVGGAARQTSKVAGSCDNLLDTTKNVSKKTSSPTKAGTERAKNIEKGIPESALGPSGKPKVHVKKHPTRKRSQDAAQDRSRKGGTPEQHKNPTKGEDPHYHPDGSNHREHHTYPGRGFPRNEGH